MSGTKTDRSAVPALLIFLRVFINESDPLGMDSVWGMMPKHAILVNSLDPFPGTCHNVIQGNAIQNIIPYEVQSRCGIKTFLCKYSLILNHSYYFLKAKET